MKIIIRLILVAVVSSVVMFGCSHLQFTKANPPQISDADNTGNEEIAKQVKQLRPQINAQYQKFSSMTKMQGDLSITLYINEDGSVAKSELKVLNGDLTPDLLTAIEEVTNGWKFKTDKQVVYQFQIGFRK